VRQMSHNHDGPGFLIEAHASRLDIIVGRQARNLRGPVRGMELRRQDLGSLPRPQFITVFDTIESHSTPGEMVAYALNSPPSLVGQASLGIFGFRLGRSMLHEVNCHGCFSPTSILRCSRAERMSL